jgi:serine/threonine protein kinase
MPLKRQQPWPVLWLPLILKTGINHYHMIDIHLNDYILDAEIGRGDLAIVYKAIRRSDNTTLAVKVVPPQFTFDEQFVRRFLEMAKQAGRLEHPNIVRTFEARKEGSILFIARELVDGRPLADILAEEGPMSPHRMVPIARQIAAALDYAHQKSLMHGDLSANRIFLGQNDYVTVADFGLTQSLAGTSLVKQGFAVGTPEVMAPERVHGQGPSRQSDLYSLGILCYQMLNGSPPFMGEPAAVLHAQAYEQPRPLHVVNPGVSLRLSECVGRMLSKGLELRYTTGSEFTRALTVAAEGSAPVRMQAVSSGSIRTSANSPLPLWQRPGVVALVVLPVLLLLLIFGFLAISSVLAFFPFNRTVTPVADVPVTPPTQTTPIPTQAQEILSVPSDTPSPAAIATNTVTPAPSPAASPTATGTPTLVPLPTPGPPVVAPGSPFTNLKLAHAIVNENQPDKVGTTFAPGSQPIYLFFDYADIEAGTTWEHRWTWGDTDLDTYNEVWPDRFAETGTAWVYYSPTGGYEPGPYQVTLLIDGETVATATFVVQPGGL